MGIIEELGRSAIKDTKRMYVKGKSYIVIAKELTRKYNLYITSKMVKNFLAKSKIRSKKKDLRIKCPECNQYFTLEKSKEFRRILNRQGVEK